ncbi:G3E family GTPase [Pseudochelatococcus lubricantis]|uniref:G3E family GTPase n=1 Tax=Pseudochelatococcus lubricantis TaxID=1538102 RepID=A0ABX0V5X4_9HYPH|nr:GTP-binding protein [Pseudochelatococcus lubricantis]NIJ59499.1 G3E family GTPase [Pseudochelatococcus lubricantis]
MTIASGPSDSGRPRGAATALPLTVLTGFLGAGKTSLLNRLLRDPALADTVVIVNEFGEIGIDHLLVETADEGLLLLSSGCLCCSIRGDLIATLEDLLRRRDNGRIAPFRRVVIETTGLADPAPILHTIIYHPYLSLRFALDGVVTVVDAVNGAATLDAYEEAVKQVAVADRIVLTKTDLIDPDSAAAPAERSETGELRARLRRLNPVAPVLDAAQGEATAAHLLDAGLYDADGKIPDVRRWLNAEALAEGHGHRDHHDHHHHDHDDHAHDHRHDVNRHDERIRAFCLTSARPVGRGRFEAFLDLLRAAHGPQLLRAKGIVQLADDPEHPVVVQGVQHLFHAPVTLPAWPDEDHTTKLVLILRDLDEAFVRRLWGAFTGEVAVDTPDAAALTANPLALR